MTSTSPQHIACVARSGVITIAESCPPGLLPLAAAWDRRRLEVAICRISRRVRGNDVVIPGMHVELDDDWLNLMVLEFREELARELVRARASEAACGRAMA